jgi:hypothetical protein
MQTNAGAWEMVANVGAVDRAIRLALGGTLMGTASAFHVLEFVGQGDDLGALLVF